MFPLRVHRFIHSYERRPTAFEACGDGFARGFDFQRRHGRESSGASSRCKGGNCVRFGLSCLFTSANIRLVLTIFLGWRILGVGLLLLAEWGASGAATTLNRKR